MNTKLHPAMIEMAAKASAIGANINLMLLGLPIQTPIQYDTLVKSSYERSVWVYACVRAIAEAAASVPLVLYKRSSDGLEEVAEHPLLNLLKNPNPQDTEIEYRQMVIAYLLLTGNSYEEIVYAMKRPQELYAWRPDRTQLIVGREQIDTVRYTVNGSYTDLEYAFVIHHKMFNALDDFYGLSPLQVARISVDLDNSTQDWNTSVVQNSGVPSGILVSPETKTLSDTERKRAFRFLRRMFGGIRNVGKPQLLEGGMNWIQLGVTPKDMDFIESRKMTREEICAVFRTPPQIVGIQDKSTYSNYSEARSAFYTDSVLPTLDRLIAAYNQKLVPLFQEDGLVLGYDRDRIEALQENADQKFKRVNEAKDLTINEKREALGYERLENADVMFVQAGMMTIPMGPDAKKYEFVMQQSVLQPHESDKKPPDPTPTSSNEAAVKALENVLKDIEVKSAEKKLYERINKTRDRYVTIVQKQIATRLEADCQQVDKALRKFKALNTVNRENVEAAVESAIKRGKSDWLTTMNASLLLVAETFGKNAFLSMMKQKKAYEAGLELKEDSEEVLEFMEELEEIATAALVLNSVDELGELDEHFQTFMAVYAAAEVTRVNDSTINMLSKLIGNAITNGETITDLAKRIMASDSAIFGERRAYMIARTEVLSASSYANRQGAKAVGVPMDKKWIASSDKRTRDSHEKANGQTVDIDEYYTVGHAKAMYPGDPSLPAKERIDCRCAERFIVKGAKTS